MGGASFVKEGRSSSRQDCTYTVCNKKRLVCLRVFQQQGSQLDFFLYNSTIEDLIQNRLKLEWILRQGTVRRQKREEVGMASLAGLRVLCVPGGEDGRLRRVEARKRSLAAVLTGATPFSLYFGSSRPGAEAVGVYCRCTRGRLA